MQMGLLDNILIIVVLLFGKYAVGLYNLLHSSVYHYEVLYCQFLYQMPGFWLYVRKWLCQVQVPNSPEVAEKKTPKSPWMPFPMLFAAISTKIGPSKMKQVSSNFELFRVWLLNFFFRNGSTCTLFQPFFSLICTCIYGPSIKFPAEQGDKPWRICEKIEGYRWRCIAKVINFKSAEQDVKRLQLLNKVVNILLYWFLRYCTYYKFRGATCPA